jgi:molecular chaperone DnaJ
VPTVKQDYYELLGVERGSPADHIKSAYRKMAMKYHPDRNPGDAQAEERFKAAAEAYAVLSDDTKRAKYDRFGHAGVSGAGQGGFNPADFADFGDILGDLFGFGDLFGGGRRRGGSQRGSDLQYELEIDFVDAVFGLSTEIQFPRTESCTACNGSGASKGSRPRSCSTCGGRGQVYYQQGFFSVGRTCSVCGGGGQVIENPCSECSGVGRVRKQHKVSVTIPPGVDSGTRLRLSGEGEYGPRNGAAGDLYVLIRVRDHAIFERDNQDLHCEVPVNVAQAALGAEITIPTLGGERKLKVHAGSQGGRRYRVKGEGVPHVTSGRRGDLIVHLRVVVPEKLTKQQRERFEELAKLLPVDHQPSEKGFIDKMKDFFV